jgi:hypothetical protein
MSERDVRACAASRFVPDIATLIVAAPAVWVGSTEIRSATKSDGEHVSLEDQESEPERLVDYRRNPAYERRVVIFYDVLGWRSQIARAGRDPEQIGDLRRLILQHVRTMGLRTNWNISVSTFSDNVVISQPICAETVALIAHMAIMQIASAMKGFLLRGGITIGEIVHDSEVVFGPALNRAYELESRVAKYPRFLVDRSALPLLGNLGDLPVDEGGVVFLDPFRLEFVQYIKEGKLAVSRVDLLEAGLPFPKSSKPLLDIASNEEVLTIILNALKPKIRSPIDDDVYEKLAWLYDRLTPQLGVPYADSYPRVRPKVDADET